jgi:hypothetical protein
MDYTLISYPNQWNGFPNSQGMTSFHFLRDKMNKEQFIQKVQQSSFIKEEKHKAMWVSCGASPDSDLVAYDVSEKFKAKFPWLHRDCGAKIFKIIQENVEK